MKDYSMYRFFKGEKENPFDKDKQNSQHMFWFYESIFDRDFTDNDSSDWHDFFGGSLAKDFINLLSTEDYERPTEKKKAAIFKLWLEGYLFAEKLYGEYGGENWYREAYYATTVR
jgi:hypothetical protein